MLKIAKNCTVVLPWALKNKYWSKSNDFSLQLMVTSHILKFCDLYYGGAEGGARFIEHRSRLQLQKSRFFGYKMLCRTIGRPSTFAPLLDRPSCSFKNVGISQNLGISLNFMSHQKLSAPPCAPPCFIIAKFTIKAQTFPIIIFHENAFPRV